MRKISLVLIAIIFVAQIKGNASVLYVGGNENNYDKIKDAIDNASSGDTIFIYNGIYHENIVINKSISIIGKSKNATIIDGKNKTCIQINADNVCIKNITIRNAGKEKEKAGIKITSSHNVISNCNILNSYCGIYGENSIYNNISKCDIFSNTFGIWLNHFSRYNKIMECNIYSNNEGIYTCCGSIENEITRCNIYSNFIGIKLSSWNNKIFLNNFKNNNENAYNSYYINYWDNGKKGNYWDDFDEPSEGAYDNNSDGIIDKPYNIPGGNNKDRYPLIKPFTIENHAPSIIIIEPINGSTVKGEVLIRGRAKDIDGNESIERIEIKIDDGKWTIADGTTLWNYKWDTSKIENGWHTIHVRAYDGMDYGNATINVYVNNKNTPAFGVILLTTAFMLILCIKKFNMVQK